MTAAYVVTGEPSLSDMPMELLFARIARAELYLMDVPPADSSVAPSGQLARDYLAYLYKLEQEGRLYGCGPVDFRSGQPAHDLAIVAAASLAEAERIAANEPLHKAGLRSNTVRTHRMNEGVACYFGRALARRAETAGNTFDPGSGESDIPYEALLARAAGAQLFLLPLEPTSKARPPEDTTMDDHFRWLRDNEMSAKLMSCGPVEPSRTLAPGVWGGGLAVVATSREEAERIAAVEPSGRAGYRALSVHAWRLDYGLAAPIGRALATLNALPG